MAIFRKRVNHYATFRYPNPGSDPARINCYADDGYRVYVIFKADGSALPDNTYNPSAKTGVGYDYASNFPAYMDMLRNEKPIWVTINEERASYVVYAAGEEVGEGEM